MNAMQLLISKSNTSINESLLTSLILKTFQHSQKSQAFSFSCCFNVLSVIFRNFKCSVPKSQHCVKSPCSCFVQQKILIQLRARNLVKNCRLENKTKLHGCSENGSKVFGDYTTTQRVKAATQNNMYIAQLNTPFFLTGTYFSSSFSILFLTSLPCILIAKMCPVVLWNCIS